MSELRRNCSNKELDNNRKVEKRSISSKGDDSTQTTAIADTHVKFESSNNAEWESIDDGKLLIYTPSSVKHRDLVIGYGLDNTLIKTKSGLEFPENHDDWTLLYPNVSDKIKHFHSMEYKIVIFTNQADLKLTNKGDIDNFKQKIENIVKTINVPIQVFIATGHNIYRKPAIGMWNYLQNKKNGHIPIKTRSSYYVGDGAGRKIYWEERINKTFSCVDVLFAENLGVRFNKPEEHFQNEKVVGYFIPRFNPQEHLLPIDNLDSTKFVRKEQEIVVMVGSPGSGKSHFVKNYLKDYGYVNTDPLNSETKDKIQQYLDQGKSVVIDNTNSNRGTRQTYREIAKKRNIPMRCFVMTTSADHAKHNMKFRSLTDPSYGPVNDRIFDSYMKGYVSPIVEEGFEKILSVKFNYIPKFDNMEHRRLYEMFLVETVYKRWKSTCLLF